MVGATSPVLAAFDETALTDPIGQWVLPSIFRDPDVALEIRTELQDPVDGNHVG